MAQQGEGKQIPEDQRSRGMNDEHPEGQANFDNQEKQQEGAQPSPPAPKTGG